MKRRDRLLPFLGLTFGLFILGALLYPVVFQTRGYSGRNSCLSNAKQIGTALMIYASDADEHLPAAFSTSGLTMLGWAGRTRPYTKNVGLFRDPQRSGGSSAPIDYAINANVTGFSNLSVATAPGRSALLFEVADARLGGEGELGTAFRLSPEGDGAIGGLLDTLDQGAFPLAREATGGFMNSGQASDRIPAAHDGRSNVVRLDSSAKSFAPNEVSAGANARTPSDPAFTSGGSRPDLRGHDRPRAEGAGNGAARATFSLR